MLRSILGVVFGITLGALSIAFVQRMGHLIYPAPDGIDLKDPEQFRQLMRAVPPGAKLFIVASWFTGAVAASFSALLVARRWAPVGWVAAATLAAMAGMTMIDIPHPLWMVALTPIMFGLGALAPIKLLGADYTPPVKAGAGLFEDPS